jgi:hypothetical protein
MGDRLQMAQNGVWLVDRLFEDRPILVDRPIGRFANGLDRHDTGDFIR